MTGTGLRRTGLLILGLAAGGLWSVQADAQGFNLNGGNRSGQGARQQQRMQSRPGQNLQDNRPGQNLGAFQQQQNQQLLMQQQRQLQQMQQQQNARMIGEALGNVINNLNRQQQQNQGGGGRVERHQQNRPGQNMGRDQRMDNRFGRNNFDNRHPHDHNHNSNRPPSNPQGYVEGRVYRNSNGTFRYQNGRLVPISGGPSTVSSSREPTTVVETARPEPVAPPKPRANEFAVKARVITPAEMLTGKQAVIRYQGEAMDALMAELEDQMIDEAVLISEMGTLGIDAGMQKQILAAVQQRDSGQAQILWTTATQDAERALALNRQLSVSESLTDLSETLAAQELGVRDIVKMRKAVGYLDLPAKDKQAVMALLDDLESLVNVYKSISSAAPASAGTWVTLSPGITEVIRHPDLNVGEAVSLGNGVFMIGTGGLGEMEMSTEDLTMMVGLHRYNDDEIPQWVSMPTSGLILRNPSKTNAPLSFTYNGKQDRLEPGQLAFVEIDKPASIRFNRGGSLGYTTKTLSPGTYEFFGGKNGWEVRPFKFHFSIDNSQGSNPFYCFLNGQSVTVEPGGVYSLESDYPVEGLYDRGNGGETRRVLLTLGVYNVGLSTKDQLLDLFASVDHISPPLTAAPTLLD